MVRPLRIEYDDAVYHVMNRGRGRVLIFHGEAYYQAYLRCIEEADQRFGSQCLAYCLMGNHYHLLIKTPRGNLSRIMRHIDGLYTQRYNRLKKTDGPLFRGRYKAILIDTNEYLLQVSRYIHRNPIEMKKPLVKQLEKYPWSSYSAYINQGNCPNWLYREDVYDELSSRQRYAAYRSYVEAGNDEETRQFYSKGILTPIWGDKQFKDRVLSRAKQSKTEVAKRSTRSVVSLTQIVKTVGQYYGVPTNQITIATRGRGPRNIPRWIAMKLCQDYSGKTLNEIAGHFNVSHYCTVSQTIGRLNRILKDARNLQKELNTISQDLTPWVLNRTI